MIKLDFTKVKTNEPLFFDELWVHDHEALAVECIANHEHGNIHFLKQHLKPGNTFVDCGGYEGYFSIIASKLNAGGRIWIFEPVPQNLELIKANKELHKVENMTIIHGAISDTTESTDIIWRQGAQCASRIWESKTDNNAQQRDRVQSYSLDFLADEIFKNTPIDVMKVDIEGAEVKLFRGGKEFFRRNKQCKVMLELHSSYIHDMVDEYLDSFLKHLWEDFHIYGADMVPLPKSEFDKLNTIGGGNLIVIKK